MHLQTTLGQFEQRFVVNEDGHDRLVVSRSSQISLVTNELGEAEALLVPPSSPGISTIIATTSDGQARTTYMFGSIEGLHLTSDSYAAVGDNGALIVAKLYNALGEPIVGQAVTFRTNLGQLSSTQAVTDENGEASVILTAGGDEGTAVVTASALGYSAKICVDVFSDLHSHNVPSSLFSLVSLQHPPSPQPQFIVTLTLNRREVRPLGTGAPNQITVTASVRDANSRPAAVSLRANAAGVRYSGGHEHNGSRPTGTFTPASGGSDRNGFWGTTYTSPEVGGFEEITISVAMSVPFTIAPFEKPLLQRLVSDWNMSVKEGWVRDKKLAKRLSQNLRRILRLFAEKRLKEAETEVEQTIRFARQNQKLLEPEAQGLIFLTLPHLVR